MFEIDYVLCKGGILFCRCWYTICCVLNILRALCLEDIILVILVSPNEQMTPIDFESKSGYIKIFSTLF